MGVCEEVLDFFVDGLSVFSIGVGDGFVEAVDEVEVVWCEAGFFGGFSEEGVVWCLAGFDVSFDESPVSFAVLEEEVGVMVADDTAAGSFHIPGGLFVEDFLKGADVFGEFFAFVGEAVVGGSFVVFLSFADQLVFEEDVECSFCGGVVADGDEGGVVVEVGVQHVAVFLQDDEDL